MIKKILVFLKDSKSSIVGLILSFSLFVTLLNRLIELSQKIYPDQSVIIVGMDPLPAYLRFLNPINDVLSTKPALYIILILTLIVFIYELITLIYQISKRKSVSI